MGISSWFGTKARYPVNGCGAVGTKTRLSRPEGERCSSSGASPMSSPIACRPWRGNGRKTNRVLALGFNEGEEGVVGFHGVVVGPNRWVGSWGGVGIVHQRPPRKVGLTPPVA